MDGRDWTPVTVHRRPGQSLADACRELVEREDREQAEADEREQRESGAA